MANGLPFSAGFETGNFSEFNRTPSGTLAVVTRPDGGGLCARATLTAGTENPDEYIEHAIGDYPSEGGDKITEMWFGGKARLSSGYHFPADSQKIVIAQFTNGIVTARTYQLYLFWGDDGVLVIDRADWTGGGTFTPIPQNVGTPYSYEPDTWFTFKIHFRNNTPSVSDGVVQMWINGSLKINRSDVNIVGSSTNGPGKLILSAYTNDATDTGGFQYWDDIWAAETDPDAGVVAVNDAKIIVRPA